MMFFLFPATKLLNLLPRNRFSRRTLEMKEVNTTEPRHLKYLITRGSLGGVEPDVEVGVLIQFRKGGLDLERYYTL